MSSINFSEMNQAASTWIQETSSKFQEKVEQANIHFHEHFETLSIESIQEFYQTDPLRAAAITAIALLAIACTVTAILTLTGVITFTAGIALPTLTLFGATIAAIGLGAYLILAESNDPASPEVPATTEPDPEPPAPKYTSTFDQLLDSAGRREWGGDYIQSGKKDFFDALPEIATPLDLNALGTSAIPDDVSTNVFAQGKTTEGRRFISLKEPDRPEDRPRGYEIMGGPGPQWFYIESAEGQSECTIARADMTNIRPLATHDKERFFAYYQHATRPPQTQPQHPGFEDSEDF